MLKDRGWPVVAVDLGNVPQVEAPAGLPNMQGLIKYRYAMRAMKEMGYTAVGIGENEASMPLLDALAEYALNEPKPAVVSANLKDRSRKYRRHGEGVAAGRSDQGREFQDRRDGPGRAVGQRRNAKEGRVVSSSTIRCRP